MLAYGKWQIWEGLRGNEELTVGMTPGFLGGWWMTVPIMEKVCMTAHGGDDKFSLELAELSCLRSTK